MARKLGSKDIIQRASRRSAYETYSAWYDKYTKDYKKGWFSGKLTKEQFETEYEIAKRAKIPNPARSIAASQELVDRQFEKQYKKLYGKELGDIRNEEKRRELFINYAIDKGFEAESFNKLKLTDEEKEKLRDIRDEFERYFY